MKTYKKTLSAITVFLSAIALIAVIVPMSASAADDAIVISSGRAYVGNGTAGIAINASYDESGNLTYVTTKNVDKDCVARFNVEKGDKVMYWTSTENAKPLADAVTVTEDDLKEDESNNAVYEKAVQNALYEALGKSKGENMTELQKSLALHDWLVVNCQYDLSYGKNHINPYDKYGAVVDGYAVCEGYTKAYNDLLGRVGINAEYVVGLKKSGLHAWSCVTIDGTDYYVDVTSDDPTPDTPGKVGRSYFLVSDDVLSNAGYSGYTSHNCTDRTYENYELFTGFYMAFIWNDDIQKFYYIDVDKVKTTSDFTETLTPSTSEDTVRPSSYAVTDNGKYISFFRPSYNNDECYIYLYNFETDEYYSYTIKGIAQVIFCRVRQNMNNIEVVRDYYKDDFIYYSKVEAFIPIPENIKKRYVTFDENYTDGKITSCEYINNYWTNGDGEFYEPQRDNLTFDGWYTAKDSGTKIENFEEIPDDNATLYAHWWGAWSISEEPTLTESGKAVRTLDGYPNVTDEVILPNLSDTDVWTRRVYKEADEYNEGLEKYTSDYGYVWITTPKTAVTNNKIEYTDGVIYITVIEAGDYHIIYTTSDTTRTWSILNAPAGERLSVRNPPNFNPSGKVTATLYDSEDNALCSVEYEV